MSYLRPAVIFSMISAALYLTAQTPTELPTPPPPSTSARSLRWSPATSNGARFINLKEGQIVHPGETIRVNLIVESGVKPAMIISRMGISTSFHEAPPYSFTFEVAEKDAGVSGQLIGFQELALFGTIVGREKDFILATTTVDVEEPDLPVSLEIPNGFVPHYMHGALNFGLGDDDRIPIYAKFPNGHELDVTDSTHLTLSSENPGIAFVADDGTVVAVGAGQTHIIVTYAVGHRQRKLLLPVVVDASSYKALDMSPPFFNFGDVASKTLSPPLHITVKNRIGDDVHMSKVGPVAGFLIDSETCSDRILPAGGSCAITVRFDPMAPGPFIFERLFIGNDQDDSSVLLFGRGN